MPTFDIVTHTRAGYLLLQQSRERIHSVLGPPDHQRRSRFSPEITDYWMSNCLQLTFSGTEGVLQEISLYPGVGDVRFGDIKIFEEPRSAVLKRLCQVDGDARETVGVTILLNLGLALSGFNKADGDSRSVSAFASGRWSRDDPALKPAQR